MRVAIVDPAAWSLTYDVPLAEALARAGAQVTLYTTEFAHGEVAAAQGVAVERWFYRYKLRWLPQRFARAAQHLFDIRRLAAHLSREADVVHVQWMPARAIDRRVWAKLARKVPVVFTAHNAQERTGRVPPELLSGFSAVVAHTATGASALRRSGLGEVWHEPIGAFTAYAQMPDPAPLPVELPSGALLVVQPGLMRPYKGIDLLLAAWPRVRRAIPEAHLVVAGRPMGVHLPEVSPPGAHFLPRFLTESEYGWLLRRASVCCLPYREIDMSGVAASALACGTPLVLSNVGGFEEFEGNGALLVAPNDSEALAERLIEVLGSSDLRTRLSAEARAAIESRFSWESIAGRYLDRYARIASATSRRRSDISS